MSGDLSQVLQADFGITRRVLSDSMCVLSIVRMVVGLDGKSCCMTGCMVASTRAAQLFGRVIAEFSPHAGTRTA